MPLVSNWREILKEQERERRIVATWILVFLALGFILGYCVGRHDEARVQRENSGVRQQRNNRVPAVTGSLRYVRRQRSL